MPTSASTQNEGALAERAKSAVLAAVYGDALGWPNETRARLVGRKSREPSPQLISWKRRVGVPYAPREQDIPSGTYSDDGQLISCVARSLIRGGNLWWQWLVHVELPFWRLYERGGGSAMLRSTKAWAGGKTPWQQDTRQYCEAGGNGAAMRILPHCIVRAHDKDFDDLYNDVFENAIATHGHPHGIMGATLYAFAVWRMLRRSGTLGFGELVEDVIAARDVWGHSPNESRALIQRLDANGWAPDSKFGVTWRATFSEAMGKLEEIRRAHSMGAMFVDAETLKNIGATGKLNGSGINTASAAIFLASRYAVDPVQGVVAAAFAKGTDTDTLASMTGALLGCTVEGEQLAMRAKNVRDFPHFDALSDQITALDSRVERSLPKLPSALEKAEKWLNAQATNPYQGSQALPDGRRGEIIDVAVTKAENFDVIQLTVKTDDGQHLEIDRIKRGVKKGNVASQPSLLASAEAQAPLESRAAATKAVRASAFHPEFIFACVDLDRTVSFYERELGLRIYEDLRPKKPFVRIEGSLLLVKGQRRDSYPGTSIRLRTLDLWKLASRLRDHGFTLHHDGTDADPPFVEVLDPDGRTVQLIEQHAY